MSNETPANDPYTVGNHFVGKYYNTLAKDSGNLHRFYEDNSQFHHFHGPEDSSSPPVKGQRAIHDKISSLGLESGAVQVDLVHEGSVDCMSSANGGIIVTVTGWMTTSSSKPKRPFVQTFFLCSHGSNRYYVLNDSFRYLPVYKSLTPGDVDKTAVVAPKATAPEVAAPKPVAAPVKESPVPAAPLDVTPGKKTEKAKTPKETEKVAEVKQAAPEVKPVVPLPVPAEVLKVSAPKAASAPVSHPKPEEPKREAAPAPASPVKAEVKNENKSWSSIAGTKPVAPVTQKPVVRAAPAPVVAPVDKAPAPVVAPVAPKPASNSRRAGVTVVVEGLDAKTTAGDLEAAFSQYGKVLDLTIVAAKHLAYVDLATAESCNVAVEAGKAGSVVLHGKKVSVELKKGSSKPNPSRGGGRSRGGKARSASKGEASA